MSDILTRAKEALRAIPGPVTAIFVLSVILMNILANKSIFNLPWLASTSGIFVSWISFLCMDAVCKRFGAFASTVLNTFAMMVSFISSILVALIVKVPGTWAASYSATSPEIGNVINSSIDATFGATWYIVIGSAIAIFLGGITNSVINKHVGSKLDTRDNYRGFAARSFISTAAGQFVDNFVFALIVSFLFFGWTMTQVLMCSFMMMLLELAIEVIFSPIGYTISKNWKNENVGSSYIDKYI